MGLMDKLRSSPSDNTHASAPPTQSPAYGQPVGAGGGAGAPREQSSPAVAHLTGGKHSSSTNDPVMSDTGHHQHQSSGGLFGGHKSQEPGAYGAAGGQVPVGGAHSSTATGGHGSYGAPPTSQTGHAGPNDYAGQPGMTHTDDTRGKKSGGLFGMGKSKNHERDEHMHHAGTAPVGGATGGMGGHTQGGNMQDRDFAFSKQDSMANAQTKLRAATEAEKAADEALMRARQSVAEAREEISLLEREADEEYRRAEAKMQAARGIRQEGDKLRFGA